MQEKIKVIDKRNWILFIVNKICTYGVYKDAKIVKEDIEKIEK